MADFRPFWCLKMGQKWRFSTFPGRFRVVFRHFYKSVIFPRQLATENVKNSQKWSKMTENRSFLSIFDRFWPLSGFVRLNGSNALFSAEKCRKWPKITIFSHFRHFAQNGRFLWAIRVFSDQKCQKCRKSAFSAFSRQICQKQCIFGIKFGHFLKNHKKTQKHKTAQKSLVVGGCGGTPPPKGAQRAPPAGKGRLLPTRQRGKGELCSPASVERDPSGSRQRESGTRFQAEITTFWTKFLVKFGPKLR